MSESSDPCAYCEINRIDVGHPDFVFLICSGCNLRSHLLCFGLECYETNRQNNLLLKCKNCWPDVDRDLDWESIGLKALRCMQRLPNLLEDPIPEIRQQINSRWETDEGRKAILDHVLVHLKDILRNTRLAILYRRENPRRN